MSGYEDFIHLDYRPKNTDLIVSFRVRVPKWETAKRAIGAVASESSIGTWAESVTGLKYRHVQKVGARVFEIKEEGKDYWIKVAYPQDHFERGNMSQILASIAGNVFGMKAVDSLRMVDIKWTRDLIKSFPGPQFGIDGIRKIFKVGKRPLMLSVPKPKVGMTTAEHCEIGRQIWSGGLDLLKDDENLTSQKFNPFEKRVTKALKIRDDVERETGDKKSYLINITSSKFEDMIRRAKFVAAQGGEYAMIDIVTTGFAAVHSIRELCGDLGLAIHAHRAMHGSFTRSNFHGFSMLCLAEVSRLLGVDQLHIGTAGFGKLVGGRDEVLHIRDHVNSAKVEPNKKMHTLGEDWLDTKTVFPVSSGGLHPGILANVCDVLGTDIMLQIGGGIHGHPKGSYAGAKAMREAVEAYMDGITLEEKAKNSQELKIVLNSWGHRKIK